MKALVPRSDYPATLAYTYLCTPATGLLSKQLAAFRAQLDQELVAKGNLRRDPIWDEMDACKASLGALFTCSPDNIALIPNFSYGFNLLMPLIKNEHFLLIENDYPSLTWPIMHNKCSYNEVANDASIEANIEAGIEKFAPGVLAISLVQFSNGLQIDLTFLQSLKTKYPELLIIADGTQFMGTAPFNFEESGIDILASSCYKWMGAGFGNGFMCFSEKVLEKINPTSTGYNVTRVFDPYAPAPKARFFEPGHQDLNAFGILEKATERIGQIGLENIEQHKRKLIELVVEGLRKFDMIDESITSRKALSPIVILKDVPGLFDYLYKNKIHGTHRNGIRLGFHFYNNSDDVEHLIAIVTSFFQKR